MFSFVLLKKLLFHLLCLQINFEMELKFLPQFVYYLLDTLPCYMFAFNEAFNPHFESTLVSTTDIQDTSRTS